MRNASIPAILCTLLAGLLAPAAEYAPAKREPGVDPVRAALRFIVKLRDAGGPSIHAGDLQATSGPSDAARVAALAERAKVSVLASRGLGGRLHVLDLQPRDVGTSADSILSALRADSSVEFAVPDRRVSALSVPHDPLLGGQWYLGAAEAAAVDALEAWDTTVGSAGVVVAVLDSGVLFEHPDLGRASRGGKFLPGYDFISQDGVADFFTANDGDGRDPDPSDPGDNCGVTSSSWHGTRVSGIISARADNGIGMAGVMWSGYLLPVRVIGRCGGFNSDILAGLRWAAGLDVPGVPPNPYPARIANLSLGSEGACDLASKSVVEEVTAAGTLVVVAAGNSGGPVSSPANCPGAMSVSGLRHAGTKTGYSSLGPENALGAPGGNCVNTSADQPCLYSINTTSNSGSSSPGAHTWTSQSEANVGTSFAAPIVSGIAGLMLAVNGNLQPQQLVRRMQAGARRPFPTTSDGGTPPACETPAGRLDLQLAECVCTAETCGAGMANAKGAVREALRPIAAVAVPSSIAAGGQVILSASGSAAACNRWIAGYRWSVVAGRAELLGGHTDTVTFQAPASGAMVVSITVTDDMGASDTAEVTITPASAATGAPPKAGSHACLAPLAPSGVVRIVADEREVPESGGSTSFTLSRTGPLDAGLTVMLETGGTSRAGADYLDIPETLSIPPGAEAATLVVDLVDDTSHEGDETLVVTLVDGGGIEIDSASAVVTIKDDETAPAPRAGEKGGGGTDLLVLLALLGLGAARLRRRLSA